MKVIGILLGFLLIGGFMYNTSTHYKKLTGIRQFSPFSGWQMANNALYAYRFVENKSLPSMPANLKPLDKMIRTYFDTTANIIVHSQEMMIANTWYMWDPKSPLQSYMTKKFRGDSVSPMLKRWASVGPLYEEYGKYLIKQYPVEFAKFYLFPNLFKYYAPPVEFLDTYNMGRDSIAPIAQLWFRFDSLRLKRHFKDLKVSTLDFYPVLVGVMNVVFVFSLIGYTLLGGFHKNKYLSVGLLLAAGLWLVNFSFSVFASQIALRFQTPPIIVFFSFCFLLIDFIIKEASGKDKTYNN